MITLLLGLSISLADVSPGLFYREDCTIAKKEQEGTTCEECSSWHGAEEDTSSESCDEEYEGTDYAYVCKTWGASAWTEVWCDGPPREGCGCATGPVGAGGLVLGLAMLAVVRRRRD